MNKNQCLIVNHKERNIISMCLSTNCKGKRQCCLICQNQLHKDHTDQLVDPDYLLSFIKTESKKPSVQSPQISQRLEELQKVLNHLGELTILIRKEMDKLSALNVQKICQDLGNKFNILKEDFQGLNSQDWNQLAEDMLSNLYIKDCEILQKNATYSLSKSMIIILKKFKELLKQFDLIPKINKEYFQNFNGPQLIKGHSLRVTGIDICKIRNLLASGSIDKTVKLWSLVDNTLIRTYEYSGEVYDVVFSNDGNLLAFGGDFDFSIKLIDIRDLQKNEVISSLSGHIYNIYRLTFSNDSKYLISGSQDQTVKVWDVSTQKYTFRFDSERCVNGIAINSDDTLLGVNSSDGNIRILDFKNQKLLCCQTAHTGGKGIQFSSDNKMLVSCDSVGVIKLWSLQDLNQGTLTLIREFKAATTFIWTVLFSPCSKYIISISNESSEIKILDSQTGEVVKLFKTNQTNNNSVVDVAISKDMDIIAYGEDNNVVVWRK